MNAKLLMIQGTSSGSGKSTIVTAFCRIFSNNGYRVAPFKAQNMSSYSYTVSGTLHRMALAQAIQAVASRKEPDVRMNPILLKPLGNYRSSIILKGSFYSEMHAKEYYKTFVLQKGFPLVLNSLESLRKENDIIIVEGAGSPAEINISRYDVANMLLAEKTDAPVIITSDIERGGCFASMIGTLKLLKPHHRDLVKGFLINKFLGDQSLLDKENGIIFSISLIIIFGLAIYFLTFISLHLLRSIAIIIVLALILKITIAIRSMEDYAKAVTDALERCDMHDARYNLSMIVRRDTKNLDEQHVLSGTIECISESTVDGIVSPLFYYSFLGPAGAFIHRVINTLDSMVGYFDNYYKDIGYMSARLDTIANYLPARITALLMVISANIIGADWKSSIQILQRDHNKTLSSNAGYPMATMAGALRIKLEKIGHYSLGDGYENTTIEKCLTAISIMKLTTILFCIILSIPLITLLNLVGWWNFLFGF